MPIAPTYPGVYIEEIPSGVRTITGVATSITAFIGRAWRGPVNYEQAIHIPFYGIYEVTRASVEVYHLVDGRYSLLPANDRGHYPIPPLGVELGIWQGRYKNVELPWLRWWDSEGNLLLTGEE